VIPAERIKLRNVPLATSFWPGMEKSSGFAFSDHDDVAATLAGDLPTELFKRPDSLAAA
jgi:hypothetical protein